MAISTLSLDEIDKPVETILSLDEIDKPGETILSLDEIDKPGETILSLDEIDKPGETILSLDEIDQDSKPERLAKSFGLGVVGSVSSLGSFLESQGIDDTREYLQEFKMQPGAGTIASTLLRKASAKVGESLTSFTDPIEEKLAVEDQTFPEKLASGAGSMATHFIPGLGIAKASQLLKLAPKVATLLGSSTSALLESAMEGGSVYEQSLNKGNTEDQAISDANKAFFTNMPTNLILARWGFKTLPLPEGKALTEVLKGFTQEATQEGIQQAISNVILKDPITEGVGESALIGGILGGGVGGVRGLISEAKLKKDLPLSDETEVDVEKREDLPTEGVDTETQIDLKEVVSPSKFFKKLSGLSQKYLTSRGSLPEKAFASKVKRQGIVGAEIQEMKFNLADYDKIAKSLKLTTEEANTVGDFLKGEVELEGRLSPLRGPVKAMREHIDLLSKEMVESGLIEGELKGVIDKNKGMYVTRAYRVHNDPKWAEKIPIEVRNRAKAYLRQEFTKDIYEFYNKEGSVGLTDENIEGFTNLLVNEQQKMFKSLMSSKEGSKALGILKKRKVIPEEIRELWGEYKDPESSYSKTVENMSGLIANQQFLSEIKTEGLGDYFFEKPIVKDGVDFSYEIAGKGSEAYSPLNGVYTSKEIKEALEESQSKRQWPLWARAYLKVVGSAKVSKTILSHVTHIRNFLFNTAFLVAQGNINPKYMATAVKATATKIRNKDNKEMRAYIKKAIELGVIDENIGTGELQDIFTDASKDGIDVFLDNRLKNIPKKLMRKASMLYQEEDNFWKLVSFESEKAKYRSALPELNESELDSIAASNVRKTMPVYSLVPKVVKELRSFPFAGTFVSFSAEVIRVGYGSLGLVKEELSNPKTRKLGARRLVGVMTAALGTGALLIAMRMKLGLGKDDDEDIRRFAAPWSKNSQLVYIGMDKDKAVYDFVDLGYIDPFNYLKAPVKAFIQGEDWKKKVVESAAEALKPFLGEDMFTSLMLDISRNKRKNGVPVYNPLDDPEKIAVDVISHLWKGFEPGTIASMKRVAKGLMGEENLYGKRYDVQQELIANLGSRITKLDINKALGFKAKKFRKDLINARFVGDRKKFDMQKKKEAYIKVYDEFRKDILAARRLGVSQRKIGDILKTQGVSKKRSRVLINGNYDWYIEKSLFKSSKRQEKKAESIRRLYP
tara:strand:- start:1194 stop:4742 length:3549 start_codon:yes stop_codon:yes gene_type:complete